MISNLFSVFDPTSSLKYPTNWFGSFILIIIIAPTIWLIPNRLNLLFSNVIKTLHYEFKTLLGPTSFNGRTLTFTSLLLLILFNNFMGLFPYIFTSTRHLITTLTLAAPLWLCFILFGWINYSKYIFAHLVPQRTPKALIAFIVVIETIRNIIRPGTLAVRLAANIIAGHLLITLLGNQTSVASVRLIYFLITIQILLLTLECAVATIQAYVFAVLSTLYSSEVTQH